MKKFDLTQQILNELISYDPVTGNCHWKERDVKWFEDGKYPKEREWKRWNSRHGLKHISTLDKTGYIKVDLFGSSYLLHRIIWLYMTGEWPDQVDHIDGNRSNNSWDNLRSVTIAENNRNAKIRKDNKSGVCGVYFKKRLNKWISSISIDGKTKHIGCYDSLEEAEESRIKNQKLLKYHHNHGRKVK